MKGHRQKKSARNVKTPFQGKRDPRREPATVQQGEKERREGIKLNQFIAERRGVERQLAEQELLQSACAETQRGGQIPPSALAEFHEVFGNPGGIAGQMD